MNFVVFFFISWLVVLFYGVMKKKLNLIESTLIFLISLVISINFSWIVINEWNLITLTNKGLPYSAFLLNRSIIIPFIILILLNFVMMTNKLLNKLMILMAGVLLLVGISFLSTSLNVTDFNKWSLWYESIYFLSLGLIAIIAYELFNKAFRNVVRDK
ncbi:hypothetical protein [Litchfieldia salsa]|uniref:Uncharacterized protein n=1 Tax=Litchfieldia salsa TaxID=930152 RepID=A0A1H0PHY4_9BACI|nr:hypothetical protein [Litchfieldia salsa]SDP04279.1 hypothetical protein SAMN05216565_101313 [Litchfieldia salsa]